MRRRCTRALRVLSVNKSLLVFYTQSPLNVVLKEKYVGIFVLCKESFILGSLLSVLVARDRLIQYVNFFLGK